MFQVLSRALQFELIRSVRIILNEFVSDSLSQVSCFWKQFGIRHNENLQIGLKQKWDPLQLLRMGHKRRGMRQDPIEFTSRGETSLMLQWIHLCIQRIKPFKQESGWGMKQPAWHLYWPTIDSWGLEYQVLLLLLLLLLMLKEGKCCHAIVFFSNSAFDWRISVVLHALWPMTR